jgi:hypothetical protein
MFKKPEEYRKIFKEKNLYGYDAILLVTRDFFCRFFNKFFKDEAWIEFISKFDKNQLRELEDLVWFYYHLVHPYEPKDTADELKLITIISIIEKLMSKEKFQTFPTWYRKKYTKNSIDDLAKAESEYLESFGATKKFREYLETYLDDSGESSLTGSIEIVGQDKELTLREIANLFYDMRSKFVHSAEMTIFCSPNAILSSFESGGKVYSTMLESEELMDVFEKSFVMYWYKLS